MYKEKQVDGMKFDAKGMRKLAITVRMTVDEHGQSISFSDDEEVLLMIPLESVSDLIKAVN